jgi:hypothetical protein
MKRQLEQGGLLSIRFNADGTIFIAEPGLERLIDEL